MFYRKKTKLIVTISLVLTITLACGATAIGIYAAPTSQLGTIATPISNQVVCEGGIYYIFCDGADESDKPISDVTEGSILFVLVRKDGYTSIGPFEDITRLNDEVVKQCEYMLKAQSITQEETNLIMEITYSSLMKEDDDVIRLLKDRVSEKVLNTINSCEAGTWYVVVENEYQYIYYNGVPHNYAWQPEISQDSATIQIFDTDKSTSTCTYVLLKVPASLKLDVYYNAAKIKYEKVNIQ